MRYTYALLLPFVLTVVATAQGGEEAPSTSLFGGVLPMMLVMFAIIYFLMIRPEQKKQKQRQQMISQVKKGDKVLTVGGIYGVVTGVKDDVVSVKIADAATVEVTKTAISNVINKEIEKKNEAQGSK